MRAIEPLFAKTRRPSPTRARPGSSERLRAAGCVFIRQTYKLYSDQDHATWQLLFNRMQEPWARYANERFLEGLECLNLRNDSVPRLDEVNAFLAPRTGFHAQAVSGCVPPFALFECLRHRKFPTAITVRNANSLDFLSEPDIFHDVAGHVPMHADPAFAEALVAFGNCAHTAAELGNRIRDPAVRIRRLTSIVKAMMRFFWFTIESGLMRYGNNLKVYGSALLSSAGEIERAVASPQVQRSDIHLDWVIHQSFQVDHYQPLLFVVESFDHLYELTGTLEKWMREGRLDHVARGEPEVTPADLDSFLQASGTRRSSH